MVPLVANVLARPISDPAEIGSALVEQVTGTVRWRECVAAMAAAGVTTFYEVGAGKVLTGLVKRIAEGASGDRDRHAGRYRRLQGGARRANDLGVADVRSHGKTALVTGASGGIGGGIARALHAQGATVALSGTRARGARRARRRTWERVHVLPCDLADKDAVEALVPAAEAAMGKLDILVNNAGITRDNLFVRLKRRGLGRGDRGQPHRDLPARRAPRCAA